MTETHSRLRVAAACLAGAIAALYVLTGTGLVAVTAGQEPGVVPPLLVGAGVFAVLAVLTLVRSGRPTLLAGAALQPPFILLYLVIAAERTPAFEAWGITIKTLQVLLLGVLLWLALQRKEETAAQGPKRLRTV
jgi:hypothetical protein